MSQLGDYKEERGGTAEGLNPSRPMGSSDLNVHARPNGLLSTSSTSIFFQNRRPLCCNISHLGPFVSLGLGRKAFLENRQDQPTETRLAHKQLTRTPVSQFCVKHTKLARSIHTTQSAVGLFWRPECSGQPQPKLGTMCSTKLGQWGSMREN